MSRLLVLLLSCVWLSFGQEASLPPGCKPITYFGVRGCELSAKQTCPDGYRKQMACPTNPMMKAPCRLMCVADGGAPKNKTRPRAKPI